MNVWRLFSASPWPIFGGHSERDESYERVKAHIHAVLQQSEPTRDEVFAAKQISCHHILGGLYLGSSAAFVESTHLSLRNNCIRPQLETHSNRNHFDAVITVCPRMELVGDFLDLSKISPNDLERSFRTHHIEWLQVGRKVLDNPASWMSLVHDCTFINSVEAQREFLPDEEEVDFLALNELKQRKIYQISSEQWFEATFKQIDKAVFGREKVLVHCRGGVSRSASVLAAYLISRFKLTTEEALSFLRRQRPCIASKFEAELFAYERGLL